ncbi:restriction endonuclease [Streptomyces sp. NPDC059979]|uniref:restriction endonuclease n=1 Tax=Streptomyces sp. NPDC059979 TaxID=3347021 RepID=UPI0036C5DA5C
MEALGLITVAVLTLPRVVELPRWPGPQSGAVIVGACAIAIAALALVALPMIRRAIRSAALRRRSSAASWHIHELDRLHHVDFEHAARDLMIRDGCRDAVRVGGAGDNGADVKGTDPQGRRWVIQCKHRRDGVGGSAVGTPDLHVLNGTGRPVYHGDVVVLVTNGHFTAPAQKFARSQRLHLVDRALLDQWASGSRPRWALLPQLPGPHHRAASLRRTE